MQQNNGGYSPDDLDKESISLNAALSIKNSKAALPPVQASDAALTPLKSSNVVSHLAKDSDMSLTPTRDSDVTSSQTKDSDAELSPTNDLDVALMSTKDSKTLTSTQDSDVASTPAKDSDAELTSIQESDVELTPIQDSDVASQPIRKSDTESQLIHSYAAASRPVHDSDLESPPFHDYAAAPRLIHNYAATSRKIHNSDAESSPMHNSMVELPPMHNSMVELPPMHNSMVELPPMHNSMVELPPVHNSIVELPPMHSSMVELPPMHNSMVELPSIRNSMVESPSTQNSVVELPQTRNSNLVFQQMQNSMVSLPPTQSSGVTLPPNGNPTASLPPIQNSMVALPQIQSSVAALPLIQNSVVALPQIQNYGVTLQPMQNSMVSLPTTQSSGVTLPPNRNSMTSLPPIRNSGMELSSAQNSGLAFQSIQNYNVALPLLQDYSAAGDTARPFNMSSGNNTNPHVQNVGVPVILNSGIPHYPNSMAAFTAEDGLQTDIFNSTGSDSMLNRKSYGWLINRHGVDYLYITAEPDPSGSTGPFGYCIPIATSYHHGSFIGHRTDLLRFQRARQESCSRRGSGSSCSSSRRVRAIRISKPRNRSRGGITIRRMIHPDEIDAIINLTRANPGDVSLKGIYYDRRNHGWQVRIRKKQTEISKYFSSKRYGADQSYEMALRFYQVHIVGNLGVGGFCLVQNIDPSDDESKDKFYMSSSNKGSSSQRSSRRRGNRRVNNDNNNKPAPKRTNNSRRRRGANGLPANQPGDDHDPDDDRFPSDENRARNDKRNSEDDDVSKGFDIRSLLSYQVDKEPSDNVEYNIIMLMMQLIMNAINGTNSSAANSSTPASPRNQISYIVQQFGLGLFSLINPIALISIPIVNPISGVITYNSFSQNMLRSIINLISDAEYIWEGIYYEDCNNGWRVRLDNGREMFFSSAERGDFESFLLALAFKMESLGWTCDISQIRLMFSNNIRSFKKILSLGNGYHYYGPQQCRTEPRHSEIDQANEQTNISGEMHERVDHFTPFEVSDFFLASIRIKFFINTNNVNGFTEQSRNIG